MKKSELQEGASYIMRDGAYRRIVSLREDDVSWLALFPVPKRHNVGECTAKSFASRARKAVDMEKFNPLAFDYLITGEV